MSRAGPSSFPLHSFIHSSSSSPAPKLGLPLQAVAQPPHKPSRIPWDPRSPLLCVSAILCLTQPRQEWAPPRPRAALPCLARPALLQSLCPGPLPSSRTPRPSRAQAGPLGLLRARLGLRSSEMAGAKPAPAPSPPAPLTSSKTRRRGQSWGPPGSLCAAPGSSAAWALLEAAPQGSLSGRESRPEVDTGGRPGGSQQSLRTSCGSQQQFPKRTWSWLSLLPASLPVPQGPPARVPGSLCQALPPASCGPLSPPSPGAGAIPGLHPDVQAKAAAAQPGCRVSGFITVRRCAPSAPASAALRPWHRRVSPPTGFPLPGLFPRTPRVCLGPAQPAHHHAPHHGLGFPLKPLRLLAPRASPPPWWLPEPSATQEQCLVAFSAVGCLHSFGGQVGKQFGCRHFTVRLKDLVPYSQKFTF